MYSPKQAKVVNYYDYNTIVQLDDCKGLMWHWNQNDYKAALVNPQYFMIEDFIAELR
jgi:hypothetical protein